MELHQIWPILFIVLACMELGTIAMGHTFTQLESAMWVCIAILWAFNASVLGMQ